MYLERKKTRMSKKEQQYKYTTCETVKKCLACFSSMSEFYEFLGVIKSVSEVHNQVYQAARLFKIPEGQRLDVYTRFIILFVDILKQRRELLMDLMRYTRVEQGTEEEVKKHLNDAEKSADEHFAELLRMVSKNWIDFDEDEEEDEESELEDEEL